jgi:hypothetical protein
MLRTPAIAASGRVASSPAAQDGEWVDCSYDPTIFDALGRLRRRSLGTGKGDYVFTESKVLSCHKMLLRKRI